MTVFPCHVSFLRSAVLEPTVEYATLIRPTVPLISAALSLINFPLIKSALQLVSILHVHSASSVFSVILPLPLVPLLTFKRKVRPFALSLAIEKSARVLITVRVLDQPFHKLILVERTLELSAVIELQRALSMLQIFLPVTVVHTFGIIVDPLALLFVKCPVSIVVVVRAVFVLALAVLFAVLEVALIDWGL